MPEVVVSVDTDKLDPAVPAVQQLGARVTAILSGLTAEISGLGPLFGSDKDPTAKAFHEGFWPNAHAVMEGLRGTGDGLHQVAANLHTYSGVFKATEAGNIERAHGLR